MQRTELLLQRLGEPESALRILDYLEEVYPVNPRLSDEIRRLADLTC